MERNRNYGKRRRGKLLTLLLAAALVAALSGCGSSKGELVEGKVNVMTSFYPLYDFATKIGGEHVHVINLVPAGVEPHDWSPKSKDIRQMNEADLLVYQGSGFETWVDDYAKSRKSNAKSRLVEASKGVTLMENHEEHEDGDHAGHDHGKESAYDPHIWLSPAGAKQLAANIRDGLAEADPAHKADYEKNFAIFSGQLDDLDRTYREALAKTQKKEIVVSHAAFGYLCRDYGLTQKAIMGIAPDAEPTAKDMKEINQFVKANQVKYIFFEELVSDKLAKTLAKDAGIETLVLNPLEGLTKQEVNNGDDYLSVMNKNLQNLLKALQ
ncbi:ABC transporter substrate-binding protein [Paenibacillus sp. J31TS4]|uniref:metal ABC transporter substrate-binding protein n=1 Tax=Paenibacillus sp. J31TS4 TaxID=2807195 RepID=UPI001AFE295D|nr:metal ABC transporter substrate-binding protein [Paenibacillus sp. J31TS4]GIP37633.1 ABC transporter substrate-binding protein [Paenibacillus sp. J31TS4]